MRWAKPLVLAVGGPTASGKSSLALILSSMIPIQIVNFDSMQVYRGMDIGTAKPGPEDRKKVPHHLLDLCDPDEPFSVGQFIPLFRKAVREIDHQEDLPVAVGGTGLYLRGGLGGLFDGPARDEGLRDELREQERSAPGSLFGLLKEKDPETAGRTMPNDLVRIVRALEVLQLTGKPISILQKEHAFSDQPFEALVFCLNPPRDRLYRWIGERVDRMIKKGFLEEVRGLKEKGYTGNLTSMKGLGYRELMVHLDGETSLQETIEQIKTNTRRYAKRQLTWFRGEKEVRWVEYDSREELPELAEKIAKKVQSLDLRVKSGKRIGD